MMCFDHEGLSFPGRGPSRRSRLLYAFRLVLCLLDSKLFRMLALWEAPLAVRRSWNSLP
jgi:hypothetical protein